MKNLKFIFFLFLSQNVLAQDNYMIYDMIYDNNSYPVRPIFPEGKNSLQRLAQQTITYPIDAEHVKAEVSVSVQFIVEKDSTITEIETSGADNPALKAEVIRFVKSLKKWTPAQIQGKAVRCYRILNVSFNEVGINVKEGELEEVFAVVEEQAEFPEGQQALFKWIETNLEYPNNDDVDGKVLLRFIVERNGRINNISVLRAFSPEYDIEAVLCVQKMPRWKPGKQRGNTVRSYFTLPIVFK